MSIRLSARLAAVVDDPPLQPDSRVLEIGCGPAAAARAVAERLVTGDILAIDRSATTIAQAAASGADLVTAEKLRLRHAAGEHFVLEPGPEVARPYGCPLPGLPDRVVSAARFVLI